jgi:hypothetical protein
MTEKSAQSIPLLRWCGIALMPAGVSIAVATLLHPSRETATAIIASEAGLIAAHALYTLAWLLVLLGLPGLYASQGEAWDGSDWQASWLHFPAPI